MPEVLPSKRSRHWLRFLALGLLFEILLVALSYGLEGDSSSLTVKLQNFFMLVHYPAFMLASAVQLDESTSVGLLVVLGVVLMGGFWGFVFCGISHLWRGFARRVLVSKRRKRIAGIGVGLVFAIWLGMMVMDLAFSGPTPFTSSLEIQSAVQGNTAFAIDLYQQLKDRPGNLFFSPFGLSTSLAMTSAGARGETENEIAKVLHFHLPRGSFDGVFGALVRRMNKLQRWNRINLTTADALWYRRDYPVTNTFIDLAHADYAAEVRPMDFKNSAQAAEEINAWVEARTRGRIKTAIGAEQITAYTQLILCDAIYFKGKWLHQFKTKDTRPAPFYVKTNQTVTVPMMWQSSEFKTAQSEDHSVSMLELPYSGEDLSMVILMPSADWQLMGLEHNDLSDLEQKLNAGNLQAWLARLDASGRHKTSVTMPRFMTALSFNLVTELKALGMPSAFGRNADFSGMDGTTNLYLANVFHKAFVKVDEAGTEAAAVSWVMVKTRSMSGRFVADHPFLFLIRDNASGSVLFLGRVVDPSK